MFKSVLDFFSEGLLVMLVEFKRTDNVLLADVHQGDDQGALASSDDSVSVSNILVPVLALLTQEHIRHTLLHVLEIEGHAIGPLKHLMNEVLLCRDQVFGVLLSQLGLEVI